MSVGKRVMSARNVILESDTALMPEGDYKAYLDSFFDEKHLVFHPVEKPTRWLIRQLTDEQKDAIANQGNDHRASARMSIRCGLVGVQNYLVQKEDGAVIEWQNPEMIEDPRLGKIISEKWIRDMGLLTDQMVGLYLLIDRFSEAHRPL